MMIVQPSTAAEQHRVTVAVASETAAMSCSSIARQFVRRGSCVSDRPRAPPAQRPGCGLHIASREARQHGFVAKVLMAVIATHHHASSGRDSQTSSTGDQA
jgi:hypothetical protein